MLGGGCIQYKSLRFTTSSVVIFFVVIYFKVLFVDKYIEGKVLPFPSIFSEKQ